MIDILEFLFSHIWPWLLAGLNVTIAVACTIHVVLQKRDVRAAIGWTGLVWLAPLLGAVGYLCFGINRIERRAASLKLQASWRSQIPPLPTEEETASQTRLIQTHPNLSGLARLTHGVTGTYALPGNQITPLVGGDQAYPAMLEAIEGAQRSIALLSYIFDNDRAGIRFLEALRAAVGRGVKVRVLIDGIGARYSRPSMIRRLREAGIPAEAFLPTLVPRMFKYANLRNHRKILVVDGKIGFTGGTNIREGHWFELEPKDPVQCLHFRLDGPIVSHLQRAFTVDWEFVSNESLESEDWFPQLDRAGSVWARGIPDGPDEDFEKLTNTLLGALAAATSSVRVVTPYFLPDPVLIHALNIASMRGADVRIYLPEVNNVRMVAWASAGQYWQMLEKGCRIFLMAPPFDHTKLFLVDGAWSLIGSTNWDPRSLRLNFEFNVECYDEQLGYQLHSLVDAKSRHAREVTLADVKKWRPLIRLRNGLARLASPYL